MEWLANPWLWVGVFVLLAFTAEAITGFGSIVIALALGALLLPIPELLPVLVPLNILMSGTLTWRYRQHIHGPTLWRLILPLMGVGLVVGSVLRPWLENSALTLLFGVLIIVFSSRELWRLWRGLATPPHGAWWTRGWMLGAGLTHGLFASGGPMLVYALSGLPLDKTRFRATLIAVWFTLNATLTVWFLVDGSLIAAGGKVLMLAPVVVVAMVLGDHLHHRIPDVLFRRCLFILLLCTGVVLALS